MAVPKYDKSNRKCANERGILVDCCLFSVYSTQEHNTRMHVFVDRCKPIIVILSA